MDLQTVFYSLGIVFYVLSILILLSILVVMIIAYRKIMSMYAELDSRISIFREATKDPATLAASMGAAVTGTAIRAVMGTKRRKNGSR